MSLLRPMMIFLTLIESSSSSDFIRQFKQTFEDDKEFYHICPGSVITVDGIFDSNNNYGNFLDEFVEINNNFPVIVLQSETDISSLSEKYHQELVCHHLIHFTNDLSNFSEIYQQLKVHFNLKYIFVIVPHDWITINYEVLNDLQSEDILLVSLSENLSLFKIYQWRIDGQVHHTNLLQDSIKYLQNIKNVNDFMGRQLRVGTIHFPPAVLIHNNNNEGNLIVDGIEADLIRLLASTLNFTIEFHFNDSNPEGMWDYLRIKLIHREFDIAFGELYILDKWLSYFSFSESYNINHECFLVPSPKPYAKWMAVIFPFSLSTWIVTMISVFFSVLTLHFVARWSLNNADASFSADKVLCILQIVGNLLVVQQPRGIHSTSIRFFMISWLFAAAIISSAYRSGFISFLTRPISPPPIQTIEQLTKSQLNKLIYNDYYIEILQNSSDPHRRLLGQQLIATLNVSYMFSLLGSGSCAVESTKDRLLYEADLHYSMKDQHKEDPPFYLMNKCIFPTRSSFGLQKNSPLKPYVDRKILRFIETGLVTHHRSKFIKELRDFQRLSLPAASNKEIVSFTLNNLQGAFYLFTFGVGLSSMIFIFELIIDFIVKFV